MQNNVEGAIQQVESIAKTTLLDKILVKEIVAPICIILGSILVYMIIKSIIKGALITKNKHYDKRKHKTIAGILINIVKYVIIIIAFLMILNVYGVNTSAILASLGLVSLVIGLALQDTLKDFLAGISILLENQYAVGDTIEVNGFKGEVISLGLKTTKIRAYTGEIKIITNRSISEVTNFSLESSLAIVDFGVAYDSDLTKVEKVITALCEDLTKTLPDLKSEVMLLGVQELADSQVTYRITVETLSMKHIAIEREIKKQVKLTLDKNNIEIPFPQVVVHNG